MEYETIIIPKGTVLFRGMRDTSTLTSDFAGIFTKDNDFCLHENFNVFFYPFPFVSSSVSRYEYTTIFVTMRDLKLVNLILPSKFNRQSRETRTGGILTCTAIPKDKACDTVGHHYDPCVDYTKVSKDVSGMLAIASADANKLRQSKTIFQNWANKYFTTYKDSRGLVGVPEFILHPRIDKTPRTEKIDDLNQWYRENKSNFNYIYLHVMKTDTDSIQGLMDDFMSDGGLDLGDDEPYHLKLNTKTGFFQIDEFSNNQSELISPNLAALPTADMVLKQKDIYRTISDKYLADTIPFMLNTYYTKEKGLKTSPGNVEISPDALARLGKFFDRTILHGRDYVRIGLGKPIPHLIYYIENKNYVFLPTPAGMEIVKQATLNNDKSFFTSRGFLEKHPINHNISAYQVTMAKTGTYVPSEQPARHINGILQHYAQKKGLLGASRRRTLRKRSLLKSR
jgi:hypothetical protein